MAKEMHSSYHLQMSDGLWEIESSFNVTATVPLIYRTNFKLLRHYAIETPVVSTFKYYRKRFSKQIITCWWV